MPNSIKQSKKTERNKRAAALFLMLPISGLVVRAIACGARRLGFNPSSSADIFLLSGV